MQITRPTMANKSAGCFTRDWINVSQLFMFGVRSYLRFFKYPLAFSPLRLSLTAAILNWWLENGNWSGSRIDFRRYFLLTELRYNCFHEFFRFKMAEIAWARSIIIQYSFKAPMNLNPGRNENESWSVSGCCLLFLTRRIVINFDAGMTP